MRLRVRLENERRCQIPFSHQDLLTGAIYRLLESSSADYSRFLHDEGYRLDGDSKRFKLFTFSNLRSRRREMAETGWMGLKPGPVEWLIASPVEDFLLHLASGLLAAGRLRVGDVSFPIAAVETLPAPDFSSGQAAFTCLSPIVATEPRPHEVNPYPLYLRASDGERLSEAITRNLAQKYRLLTGERHTGPGLRLEFDADYLQRKRGGTKLVTFKGIDVIGTQAPFTAAGDPALLQVGYECGFGEKNAGGFGMVDVWGRE